MRSRNIHQVFILLTALLIVVLGSGAAFAQGNGHGGNKHGNGGENRGNRGEDRGNRGENRGNRGEDRGGWKQQAREQRNEGWQGKENGNGNGRWQREQRQEQRSERPWYDRGQRQVWRQEQRRPQITAVPDYPIYQPRQNYGQWKKQRRENDNDQGDRGSGWNGYGGFKNYGQWRSNEVHIRNAERKAWKNEEKALRYNRRDNRSYGNGYQYSYYPDNGYVDQYPQHARANVLRNLIANVFGSNTGYNNNYYSQAQPVYYGNQYYPVNYGSNYYNAYPQYQSYAATPYYYSYQPYGYAYNPQYNGDSYNADNYYYYDQQPSYYTSSNSGGGFMQQLFSKLLALGYDQGYNEGLNARRAGYGDRYYSDPYAYGNTNYVSYSNTLGQNRRCLSDGYELGYNDALYNQRGSDPYQDSNVDLVSVLIGSVLQGI